MSRSTMRTLMCERKVSTHRYVTSRTGQYLKDACPCIRNSHVVTWSNRSLHSPAKPPMRRFGSDLTRALGNFTPALSAKKKVCVKSSVKHTKAKPVLRKRLHNNNNNNNNYNNTTTETFEYTLTFQPGPIGMKLEPTLESQGKEVGIEREARAKSTEGFGAISGVIKRSLLPINKKQ
jgi:hypothetical protein